MNKNIFILPVSATFREIKYPEQIIRSAEGLEKRLKNNGLDIILGKKRGAQTISDIYEATFEKKRVLVKHTENTVPQTPIEFLIMSDAFDTDLRVLKTLELSKDLQTIRLIRSFPKIATYIAENPSNQGFVSLAKQLENKKVSIHCATAIGSTLARLAKTSQTWKEFHTSESAHLEYYERSLEVLISYPGQHTMYRKLETEFTQFDMLSDNQEGKKRFFVWPDSTPQNIMINAHGEVLFMNFERSYWGDQQYMIAVFIAHIMMYSLLHKISRTKTAEYMEACMKAYEEIEPIRDQQIFVQYVAMEILHRSNGKSMPSVKSKEDKLAIQKCGLTLFEGNIKTVKTLMTTFKKMV